MVESRSRSEATMVRRVGRDIPNPPLPALDVRRDSRFGLDDERDGTRTDELRVLANCPFSTLSWIISSSILDISSIVFFFLSIGFVGERSVIGLAASGENGPVDDACVVTVIT